MASTRSTGRARTFPLPCDSDNVALTTHSAFNFGLPSLPWINGRDLTGLVVRGSDPSGRVRTGDLVLVPSTDYRDIRKAAFQEYAITTASNAARIPSTTCPKAAASLGVAFVAAVLSLGVSLGLDLSAIDALPGPDLINTLKGVDENEIPVDVRGECFSASEDADRIKKGDWLAIWGGMLTFPLPNRVGIHMYTNYRSLHHNGLHHSPTCQTSRSPRHLRRRCRPPWR